MERININKVINKNICIHEYDGAFLFSLKKSVENYGQLRPLILNKQKELIDGHALYEVLKELNHTEVWVVIIDSSVNKEQIYCELNIKRREINTIKFFKYLKNNINLDNNCLTFSKKTLLEFIKLLDFKGFSKKTENSLF